MLMPWRLFKTQKWDYHIPSDSTCGRTPRRTESRDRSRYLTPIFIATLFTRAKRRQQPGSIDTWTENVVCTHWEYNAALKRKELLAQATTWISIKDIMPSEIIQSLCF